MGKVKRVLASGHLETPQNPYVGIELCETIHVHMPNYRFELTAQEFEVFAQTVRTAYEKWISMGKPDRAEFAPLAGSYLPKETAYPNRFEIEEQTIPLIHIHMRGLSLRKSLPDFKAFTHVIAEADKALG